MGDNLVHAPPRELSPQLALRERKALDIADREKARLGRELHDGLCQTLAGIAALGTALSKRLAVSGNPAAPAAAEITRLLNEAIGQARDLARGLGPIELDDAGLADALETLARTIRHQFHVSCTFACDGDRTWLGRETKLHLYRIAQEAVHNAIVHGRADRIEIGLTCDDAQGVLRIRDNGVGLPEDAADRGGMGLRTMCHRARAVHGAFQVARHPPRGTLATCVFPLFRTSDARTGPDRSGIQR